MVRNLLAVRGKILMCPMLVWHFRAEGAAFCAIQIGIPNALVGAGIAPGAVHYKIGVCWAALQMIKGEIPIKNGAFLACFQVDFEHPEIVLLYFIFVIVKHGYRMGAARQHISSVAGNA